mmetsp:Transcript_22524/g.55788  ORF Transcript_22524/g.55788 Transcript_22524/m.55788 type:complete len:481 (+) Transcript_22524:240-1682(+)
MGASLATLKGEKQCVYKGQSIKSISKSVIHVTVDPFVRKIKENAFQDCEVLQSIVVPTTVETIGKESFKNCSSLVDLQLRKGLTSIGSSAFFRCTSLMEIDLPEGLTLIERSTFYSCTSLRRVSVPATVETIRSRAFFGCSSLIDVQLHEGLVSIGDNAFAWCTALSVIGLPTSLRYTAFAAFYKCKGLLGVEIPTTSNLKLSTFCFFDCRNLVTISVPNSNGDELVRSAFCACPFFQGNDAKRSLQDRFANLPIHEVCYNSSSASVDELNRALDSCNSVGGDNLKDAFGLTPLHILVTSPYPKTDVLERLLEFCPIWCKDKDGNTMMDYLLRLTPRKAIPLMQLVLKKAVLDRLSGCWLERRWRLELANRMESIWSDDNDDNVSLRNQRLMGLLEYFGSCMRTEMTSLMELALWKMRMRKFQKEGSENDINYRESCQCQCGMGVVAGHVTRFLWEDGPLASSVMSEYPLCRRERLSASE